MNKDNQKPEYLKIIKDYISSYIDSVLYSLGDLLVKFNLTTIRLVVIILFAISILLFLGIGLSLGIAELFGLPVFAGFLIMAGIMFLLLLLILQLLKGKKRILTDFLAELILGGIEQIRGSIHDLNEAKDDNKKIEEDNR